MRDKNLLVKLPVTMIFILLLYFPLVDRVFKLTPQQMLPENRIPGKKGQFTFPLRSHLIRANNFIKYKWFGVSAVPKVIAGKEGWLFQARENKPPDRAGYFSSIQPFTPQELEQWRRVLEQRRQWLAKRDIHYLLILAPDKSTIYPEYLPDSLQPFYRQSRLDQLAAYLKKHSTVPLVELRPALLAAKNQGLIYYKTDSHWNPYGACIAYGEIIKHLAAHSGKSEPMVPADFKIRRRRNRSGGNLAIMLSLQDRVLREERLKLIPRTPFRVQEANLPQVTFARTVKPEAFQCPGADFPNAVMFHDSFGRQLKPFLTRHFSRIVYIRDWGFRFNLAVIREENPKIVMDEIAEHFLYSKILSEPQQ